MIDASKTIEEVHSELKEITNSVIEEVKEKDVGELWVEQSGGPWKRPCPDGAIDAHRKRKIVSSRWFCQTRCSVCEMQGLVFFNSHMENIWLVCPLQSIETTSGFPSTFAAFQCLPGEVGSLKSSVAPKNFFCDAVCALQLRGTISCRTAAPGTCTQMALGKRHLCERKDKKGLFFNAFVKCVRARAVCSDFLLHGLQSVVFGGISCDVASAFSAPWF